MFCPKCATQNVDGASFCRTCGANISLLPQALTGQLPPGKSDDLGWDWGRSRRRRRRYGKPTREDGIRQMMTGLGFLAVAISIAVFAPTGHLWWFWLLIPAFTLLGNGISQIMHARNNQGPNPTAEPPLRIPNFDPMTKLPARNTGELMTPVPSVTEATTRHLGAEATTRHSDPLNSQKPS